MIGGGREVCPEELHGHELLLQAHPAQWKVHRHQPDAQSRHQINPRADPVKRSTMTNADGAVTSDQCHPLSHRAPASRPTQGIPARIPHAPNPLPHLRAPARVHREAHAHEPRLPAPDANGAPGTWICQATASPAPPAGRSPPDPGGRRDPDRSHHRTRQADGGQGSPSTASPATSGAPTTWWAGRSCATPVPGRRPAWRSHYATSCWSCAANALTLSECNAARRWAVCSRRSLRLRAQEPPPHPDQRFDQSPGMGPMGWRCTSRNGMRWWSWFIR